MSGDSEKPVGDGRIVDRPRASGEHEERGLERILGIVLVPKHTPTHTQNHR
jgi:hypothetical protein